MDMHSGYDVEEIVKCYRNHSMDGTLFHFMEKRIQELRQNEKTGTALNYQATLDNFRQFRNGKDIPIEEINTFLIKSYEQHLLSKGLVRNTTSFYMRNLRAIYNDAVNEGFTTQCHPFRNVYTGVDKTRKRAVNSQTILRLKKLDLSDQQPLAFARDLFLFSFFTRGMAFVDIANLKEDNIKGKNLTYIRRKTGQILNIKIEPCLEDIIKKHSKSAKNTGFLLPVLKSKTQNYRSALRLYNMHLKILSTMINVKTPLSSYVPRHTWATMANKKGFSLQLISEGMGHQNVSTTRIYLSAIDHSCLDRANATIIKI